LQHRVLHDITQDLAGVDMMGEGEGEGEADIGATTP